MDNAWLMYSMVIDFKSALVYATNSKLAKARKNINFEQGQRPYDYKTTRHRTTLYGYTQLQHEQKRNQHSSRRNLCRYQHGRRYEKRDVEKRIGQHYRY